MKVFLVYPNIEGDYYDGPNKVLVVAKDEPSAIKAAIPLFLANGDEFPEPLLLVQTLIEDSSSESAVMW